jgi:hypothetical protein
MIKNSKKGSKMHLDAGVLTEVLEKQISLNAVQAMRNNRPMKPMIVMLGSAIICISVITILAAVLNM